MTRFPKTLSLWRNDDGMEPTEITIYTTTKHVVIRRNGKRRSYRNISRASIGRVERYINNCGHSWNALHSNGFASYLH